MQRKIREVSSTGIYHVLLQGLNNGDLFTIEEDYSMFLKYVGLARLKLEFVVYAYCLAPKHVHLLVKVPEDVSIGTVVSRITVSYVLYKNSVNGLPGHLLQTPFKSFVIETDTDFLSSVRSIHHNPTEENLIKKDELYPWSSYTAYQYTIQLGKEQTKQPYLDTSFVLGMFDDSDGFIEYMNKK